MSYAALLKKHLMSIYMRLDKIEKGLTDFGEELKKQEKELSKTEADLGKKLDEKASELNQHLSELDAKLTKENSELRDSLAQIKDDVDKLAKEKLQASEFHEFVDKFVEALSEKFPAFEGEGLPELPSLEGEGEDLSGELPELPEEGEEAKPIAVGSKKKAQAQKAT